MKIMAAHQPNFLPYLGLFYKIYKSDEFIFVDNVQFSCQRGISHHRNLIKTPSGAQMFYVPVTKNIDSKINEVKIDYSKNWKKTLLRTFEVNYKRAPYFEEIYSWIKELFDNDYQFICELNINSIKSICEKWGIKTNWVVSSEQNIDGHKNELVLNLMKFSNANIYYSGIGAKAYLNIDLFKKEGFDICYSDYNPIRYIQQWNGFIENLSVIDYLFNCGFNNPFGG